MKELFKTIHNIWSIQELQLKIVATLGFLLVYGFASYVPLPGIDPQGISDFMANVNPGTKGLMQILSSFTGGAFNRASILALGIMPYGLNFSYSRPARPRKFHEISAVMVLPSGAHIVVFDQFHFFLQVVERLVGDVFVIDQTHRCASFAFLYTSSDFFQKVFGEVIV